MNPCNVTQHCRKVNLSREYSRQNEWSQAFFLLSDFTETKSTFFRIWNSIRAINLSDANESYCFKVALIKIGKCFYFQLFFSPNFNSDLSKQYVDFKIAIDGRLRQWFICSWLFSCVSEQYISVNLRASSSVLDRSKQPHILMLVPLTAGNHSRL